MHDQPLPGAEQLSFIFASSAMAVRAHGFYAAAVRHDGSAEKRPGVSLEATNHKRVLIAK